MGILFSFNKHVNASKICKTKNPQKQQQKYKTKQKTPFSNTPPKKDYKIVNTYVINIPNSQDHMISVPRQVNALFLNMTFNPSITIPATGYLKVLQLFPMIAYFWQRSCSIILDNAFYEACLALIFSHVSIHQIKVSCLQHC